MINGLTILITPDFLYYLLCSLPFDSLCTAECAFAGHFRHMAIMSLLCRLRPSSASYGGDPPGELHGENIPQLTPAHYSNQLIFKSLFIRLGLLESKTLTGED